MTFYFYEMSLFDYSFYDNVDNKKISCARSQYKNGVCIELGVEEGTII